MKSISTVSLLLAAAAMPTFVTAMGWKMSNSKCDGSPFSNLNVAVTCNNGSTNCGLGDTVEIAGNMYASHSFDDADVTLQACVMGYCPDDASTEAGTLCDDWITPTASQDCGASGTYSVYHEEDIPSNDDIPSALMWFVRSTVTVNMKVGDDEECEGETSNAYGRSNNMTSANVMSYSVVGSALFVMLGLGAHATRKRRQRADEKDDDDDMRDDFVEMTDHGIGIVVV